MSHMSRFVVLCVLSMITSSASAQIIFEPVRYQYGNQSKYYYGGCDPFVHRMGTGIVDGGGHYGRVNGWAFVSGDIDRHREVADEPIRVFRRY